MMWGSVHPIATHAGLNPLCFCPCPDNPGGRQFDDDGHAIRPKRKSNPLVRFDRITTESQNEKSTTSHDSRDTFLTVDVNDFDEQVASLTPAIGVSSSPAIRTGDKAWSYLDPGTPLAPRSVLTEAEWLTLLLASDDE